MEASTTMQVLRCGLVKESSRDDIITDFQALPKIKVLAQQLFHVRPYFFVFSNSILADVGQTLVQRKSRVLAARSILGMVHHAIRSIVSNRPSRRQPMYFIPVRSVIIILGAKYNSICQSRQRFKLQCYIQEISDSFVGMSLLFICLFDQGKIFRSYCVINQNLYFVLGAYSTIQDTHGFAWAPKDKRKYGIRNVQLFVGISDLIVLIRKRASTKVIR